uniref:UV-stimulated scaffold protein A n=1 Tax=Sparus aurata TaxID=8175 RepID=A0A671V5M3_SPAAU
MESSQRDRLSVLVEELTTSGQPQLNQDKMKEIKKICKVSNDCLDHVYHSVMSQLSQEHAEVRLSAFQIATELFTRSHHFRMLLVDNFQEFLELTVETDSEQPLPPPKQVARKLRSLAIQTVQSWQASYGTAYKKLALGYHFLKQVKKVDFQDAEARTVAERRRIEERQRRMETIYKERVEAASRDMDGKYYIVFTKSGAEEQLLRRALDLKQSLEAALQKHKELHIDYRTRIRKVMKASSGGEEDSSDDSDDFDEVPEKEGYEPHIPEHLRAEYGLDPSPSTSAFTKNTPAKRPTAPPVSSSSARRLKQLADEVQDPTCAAATLLRLRQNLPPPTDPRYTHYQKAADAPVVPFGLDLYYWGQEQPNAGKIVKSASQHQFWFHAEGDVEVENKELLAESKSRYISFPGRFIPVSHYCRAPLDNGSLCQRQDRLKCPFHGRVIPRDDEGRPIRQEDQLREERRKREQQPDWRDAELMRDIEAATGEDLGSDRVHKKGKGKKKKFPNLSDVKQTANTARSRLEKKVFNKSTVRRVAQVMSKADGRKHEKFSNQFNYALN